MPYNIKGYENRAKECAQLAKMTDIEMIRGELLTLRQTHLNIVERLR